MLFEECAQDVRFLICSPRMDPREADGGADRDRTGDPLLAKQVLSQLSYSPRWDVLFLDMQVSCVDAMEVAKSFSKGGDPAAPSDTATLLRLHPSH